MRLVLVRHAPAERAPEGSRFRDPLRALTRRGRKRFRKQARERAELADEVGIICTSPALRAVQTAELLAAAFGHEDVRVLEELRPDAAPEALLAALARFPAGCGVALVGHKRVLAGLAALLDQELTLRKGAIADLGEVNLGEAGRILPAWASH